MPVAQKNRIGLSTPRSPPWTRSSCTAAIMLRKMPRNRAATSRIGCQVKELALRYSGRVDR
jgi:hypothetical protein